MTELTDRVLGMVRPRPTHRARPSGPLGLDPHLLSILACPDTHHSLLTVDEEAGELLCTTATAPWSAASRCCCSTRRGTGTAGRAGERFAMTSPEIAEEVLDDLEVLRARDPGPCCPPSRAAALRFGRPRC